MKPLARETAARRIPVRALKSFSLQLPVLLTLLLLLEPLQVRAQEAGTARTLTQYNLRSWSHAEGFPAVGALDIEQTRDGYLWFGTHQGLARFDGVSFDLFTNSLWEELNPGSIHTLRADPRGGLWFGGHQGLYYLDRGDLSAFDSSDGLSSNHLRDVEIDAQGRLWVATLRALNVFDRENMALLRSELRDQEINVLLAGSRGHVWAGTGTAGLFRFELDGGITQFLPEQGLPDTQILSLAEDAAGRLWIGTASAGLVLFENETFFPIASPPLYPSLKSVTTLLVDPLGSVWFGSDNGLYRWNEKGLSRLSEDEGLTHNQMSSLHLDLEGTLWVGTYYGGLNRLHEGKFTNFGILEGLPSDTVHAFFQDPDGSIWIASEGGACRLEDGTVIDVLSTDSGHLPQNKVRDVYRDRSGVLWVATYGGLVRIEDGRSRVFTTRQGLSSDAVRVLLEDRAGTLWVGTRSGLNRYRDGLVERVVTEHGSSNDLIMSLHEDRRGALWVGTSGGGLLRFEDGRWTRFTSRDGLASDVVFRLHEDDDGALWIGTSGGLNRLAGDEISGMTIHQGLPNNSIFQVLEDREGRFWMVSGAGLIRTSRQELENVMTGRADSFQPMLLDRSDGLRGEFQGTGKGILDRQGRLWLPTLGGAATLTPGRVPANDLPPPVYVERMAVDNRSYRAGTPVVLGPGSRSFEFHYTALSFVAPEKVRFRYKLEGYDERWIDPGPRRSAFYTNLGPGSYRFKVLASNNDGIWSQAGASMSFEVEPAFYETRWFLVLAVLGFVSAGVGIYKRRVRRLKLHNQQLEETVEARTREIREKNRENERLLLNILPVPIAQRLKGGERTIADSFEDVTVLFADLVGFTPLAGTMPSAELVDLLNELFSSFDTLTIDLGVEKIKTIGDAYMAVAGLPSPNPNHARAAAEMALSMLEQVEHLNARMNTALQLRIGLNTGPVVAGVIGKHKFVYDLWGDTVNIASRMESHGQAGHVHVSASTYECLRAYYEFGPSIRIDVKGKGQMETYMLIGRKKQRPVSPLHAGLGEPPGNRPALLE